ncbi:unnamed protein product [Owenia fusiformis]|uniref:Uncharacterized protein n=1 Tax=Owenia fusiformis TaxID=6347 RepID=A0A8J1T4N0_OWEFU|nr:unnamed protein product [Owenia fusiformis]
MLKQTLGSAIFLFCLAFNLSNALTCAPCENEDLEECEPLEELKSHCEPKMGVWCDCCDRCALKEGRACNTYEVGCESHLDCVDIKGTGMIKNEIKWHDFRFKGKCTDLQKEGLRKFTDRYGRQWIEGSQLYRKPPNPWLN